MTENKRFKIVDEQFISYYGGTGHKISNEECGFWLWHSKIESQKVCDKLNGILDENEQLKKDCTVLIYHNQEYRKENEQLKSTINTLTHDNTKMKKVLNTTKNENISLKKSETATEELLIQQWQQNTKIKHTIKEAIYNERTELGKSVLKQLMEAIQ